MSLEETKIFKLSGTNGRGQVFGCIGLHPRDLLEWETSFSVGKIMYAVIAIIVNIRERRRHIATRIGSFRALARI